VSVGYSGQMSESSQGPGFHPLYQQIKELLIQRVLSGDWKPGEVLPSEAKLAAEYQVSQGTVRKAIEEMAADHLVIRHQGKGTFVSARGSESALHFFSIVTEDGRIASPGKAVHFAWSEGEASERERRDLRLAEDEPVYHIYRIRPVDDQPALIERIVVSSKRFPGLPELMRDAVRMNSYLIMEKHFGVLVVRAEEWIEAVGADAEDAAQLGVAEGAPLISVHRISYALDGTPAETRRMRFPTGRLRYRNTLR
jgi:GntR family transcriptional regulator